MTDYGILCGRVCLCVCVYRYAAVASVPVLLLALLLPNHTGRGRQKRLERPRSLSCENVLCMCGHMMSMCDIGIPLFFPRAFHISGS